MSVNRRALTLTELRRAQDSEVVQCAAARCELHIELRQLEIDNPTNPQCIQATTVSDGQSSGIDEAS